MLEFANLVPRVSLLCLPWSSNDQGRQRRETLGTRLRVRMLLKGAVTYSKVIQSYFTLFRTRAHSQMCFQQPVWLQISWKIQENYSVIQYGPRPKLPRSVSIYTLRLSWHVDWKWFTQTSWFVVSRDKHRSPDLVFLPRIFQLRLRVRSHAYATPADSREPDSKRNNGDLEIYSIHKLSHSFALRSTGSRVQSTVPTIKLRLATFARRHLLQHY